MPVTLAVIVRWSYYKTDTTSLLSTIVPTHLKVDIWFYRWIWLPQLHLIQKKSDWLVDKLVAKPESLIRVEKLTARTLEYFEANLLDCDKLRQIFAKVCKWFPTILIHYHMMTLLLIIAYIETNTRYHVLLYLAALVLKYVFTFDLQSKISCVLHLAAFKSVKESWDIPLDYYANNICGSVNLFKVITL